MSNYVWYPHILCYRLVCSPWLRSLYYMPSRLEMPYNKCSPSILQFEQSFRVLNIWLNILYSVPCWKVLPNYVWDTLDLPIEYILIAWRWYLHNMPNGVHLCRPYCRPNRMLAWNIYIIGYNYPRILHVLPSRL